jgi:Spy/CpxP family protein refolding chaperone
MKKITTLLVMMALAITVTAQQQNIIVKRQGEGFMKANPERMHSNFSEDQQKQMQELRLKLQKENLQLSNELNEKRAQLKTLQQVDKPNMKSVNSKIDEISALQNKKMKLMAEHRNNVRNLLTDEQKVQFDLRGNRGGMMGKSGKMGRAGKQGRTHLRTGEHMNGAGMGERMHQQGQQMHREIEIRQIEKK